MFILMILETKSPLIKMISFNLKNKKLIDKKFDRLHEKKKILLTKKFIIYDYSIFVV